MTDPASTGRGAASHERASDRVLAELRQMIITLELAPGAVVTEESLCAVLDCSRTPLREALRLLAREHLVVAVPHRGVSIADLSIVDYTALAEATEGVECFLVRLAAERVTDEQLARMDELLKASDMATAAGDLARVAELDFRFHHVIGEAAHNHLLIETQDTLHRLSMRFVFLGFRRAGSAAGAVADHRRIIEAIRAGDPDRAEAVAHEHAQNARDRQRAAL